jgi:hypothetical protein
LEAFGAHCVVESDRLRSYGVTVSLGFSSELLRTEVLKRQPPVVSSTRAKAALQLGLRGPTKCCTCGEAHTHYDCFVNGRLTISTKHLEMAADTIGGIWKHEVAKRSRTRRFVHAGVVEIGAHLVIVPGSSMSGKTTLVRAFLDRGATLYSDEYALLDRTCRVEPYPQPLGIRVPGMGWKQRSIGGPGTDPPPARSITAVLLTQFEQGARWEPRRASIGEMTLGVASQLVGARRSPASAIETACRAVANSIGWIGARGDASETVERVLRQLSSVPEPVNGN